MSNHSNNQLQAPQNNDDYPIPSQSSRYQQSSKKTVPFCNSQLCSNPPQRTNDLSNENNDPKIRHNIPEIRVNSELVEEAHETSPINQSQHQPQQNQNQKFLTVPDQNPNQFNDFTPPNFPIYKDNRISNQSSKSNYSREFRSRIPKKTSTPKHFPTAEDKNSIMKSKNDSINMLSVAISTVMLLAANKTVPDNYQLCSTKYLQLIRDKFGQSPPNVKKILTLLKPPSSSTAERHPKIEKGGISCSCPKQRIVPRYK